MLGDELILLVQNTYYGTRDNLPFDLKHKAGSIQYRLAPDAANPEIAAAKMGAEHAGRGPSGLSCHSRQVRTGGSEVRRDAAHHQPGKLLGEG